MLIRPLLTRMTQGGISSPRRLEGIMADPFPKSSHGRRFIRGIFDSGIVRLPQGLHSSGVLSSLQGCNALVDIAPGTSSLAAGDKVNVVLL